MISLWNKIKTPFLILLLLLSVSRAGAQDTEKSPAVGTSPEDASSPSNAQPLSLPFVSGEKLVYEVRYLGINAGEAVLAVLNRITLNGHEVYPLLSTVQSNDFASLFYPVNNRIESYLDARGLYSHFIKVKQHEGKRRREKQIEFDQMEHKATLTKNDQQTVFDIPPKVHDSLSSLYYFRTHNHLVIGSSVFIDVHESEKNWKLEIRILGKEAVTTPMGTFDTLKVQAMPHYEGIFLSKGDLFIWVTDDDLRVPVKIRSKIKVGSITATLISRREGQSAL